MAKSEVLWGSKGARSAAARDQKRMLVLETAARMFNDSGFERTALTDIAEAFGITKPSLYYYVKSKEDILFSISKLALEEMISALNRTQSGHACGRDQLSAFLTEYISLIQNDFGKCLVTSNKAALSEKSRKILRDDRKIVDHSVRNIITKGVADGSLVSSSVKFSTFAIFGAINWMCYWHQDSAEFSKEEIVERFLDFFLQGLEPRNV
jgi:AcrR family transcriptional regulator